MNTNLKYAVNGVLLAALFFISLKLISFLMSMNDPEAKKANTPIDISTLKSAILSDPRFEKGKQLFSANCSSCHALVHVDGPSLAGVEERVPDKKLLYSWIRNSEAVLKSGDAYFTNLYNEYNKTAMQSFPALTDEDIDAILFYIKVEGSGSF
ncbi:MAG TPA: cytochrome c [Panacibacter sp.]|nr:cytochrome c [Panacibacter sp.]